MGKFDFQGTFTTTLNNHTSWKLVSPGQLAGAETEWAGGMHTWISA